MKKISWGKIAAAGNCLAKISSSPLTVTALLFLFIYFSARIRQPQIAATKQIGSTIGEKKNSEFCIVFHGCLNVSCEIIIFFSSFTHRKKEFFFPNLEKRSNPYKKAALNSKGMHSMLLLLFTFIRFFFFFLRIKITIRIPIL